MQLALSYDAAYAGADDWTQELAWLRRAVDVVGHKEVAFKLDIAPSQLTDALLERERKDIKGKWIRTIVRMVPEEMRAEYLRIVNTSCGYEAPKRKKPLTPEQELRQMRELLKREAPAVLTLLDKEMGNT